MQDVKPVFTWAKANGETKIVDRILIRLLPEMVKLDHKITAEMVDESASVPVPESLHAQILAAAEEMVGKPFDGTKEGSNV